MRQRHIKLHILAGSGCANDEPGLKLPVRPLARLRTAELRILPGGTPPGNRATPSMRHCASGQLLASSWPS